MTEIVENRSCWLFWTDTSREMRSKSSKEEKKNHPQRGAAASFQATFNGLYLMVYHHISHRMHMPGHKCDHPNLQNCAAKKCKSAYLRKKCLHPSQIGYSIIACETVLVLTAEADSSQFFFHKPENVIRQGAEKYGKISAIFYKLPRVLWSMRPFLPASSCINNTLLEIV